VSRSCARSTLRDSPRGSCAQRSVPRTCSAISRASPAAPRALAYGASVVAQGSLVALNAWLGAAVGVAPGAAAWLLARPLAKVIAMAPISLGGLGVRETALASLLAPFGVPATLAVAQGLVWQSILFAFGVIAGAWVWLGRGTKSV